MAELKTVNAVGQVEGKGATWNELVQLQIANLAKNYTDDNNVNAILASWHDAITIGMKRNENFSPHVNGFYSVFMVHGTWYEKYKQGVAAPNNGDDYEGGGAVTPPTISESPYEGSNALKPSTPGNHFNMMATDIDVPDITEEYISVSSRLRNSFVPSRNYFVSDFSVSYIENVNLEIIRYHEAWFKYLDLLKRGEVTMYADADECKKANSRDIFLDMPFANAIWVAVYKPFTTDIQLLIKLIGVMPVSMPLKQVVGNRSASKMTVLNMQYKAADMFYKFYNGATELMADTGALATSFKNEILKPLEGQVPPLKTEYPSTYKPNPTDVVKPSPVNSQPPPTMTPSKPASKPTYPTTYKPNPADVTKPSSPSYKPPPTMTPTK